MIRVLDSTVCDNPSPASSLQPPASSLQPPASSLQPPASSHALQWLVMLHRLLFLVEASFLLTFWWQTRVNLREWWPDFFTIPLNSDYVTPFVYLSDIFLALMLGIWIIKDAMSGQRPVTRKFFDVTRHRPTLSRLANWLKQPLVWLGAFVVVAAVSLWVNDVGWWGWYGWIRLFEGVLLAVYLGQRLRDAKTLRWYGLVLIGGLAAGSMLLVAEWLGQRSMGLQWIGEWQFDVYTPGIAKITFEGSELPRAPGTFPHPNVAGGVIALAMVVVGWSLVRLGRPPDGRTAGRQEFWAQLRGFRLLRDLEWGGKIHFVNEVGEKARWLMDWLDARRAMLLGLVFLLLGLGLLVTFSRSAWLVAVTGVGLVWVVFRQKNTTKILRNKWWIVGVSGAILIGMVFGPLIYSRFAALDTTDTLSIERRVQLMEVALEQWQASPWVGVGPNNFVPRLTEYGPLYGVGIWREPVHNLFILIVTEVGSVGLIAWVLFMITLITPMITRYKKNSSDGLMLLLVLWLCFILLGMVDHYWWTSQQGRLVLWLLVGGSLAELNGRRKVEGGIGRLKAEDRRREVVGVKA